MKTKYFDRSTSNAISLIIYDEDEYPFRVTSHWIIIEPLPEENGFTVPILYQISPCEMADKSTHVVVKYYSEYAAEIVAENIVEALTHE